MAVEIRWNFIQKLDCNNLYTLIYTECIWIMREILNYIEFVEKKANIIRDS